MAESIQGRFLWYQLNTSDGDKGIAFYRDLIGWGIEIYHPEGGMRYPMFKNGEMPMGGVYELPAEGPEAAPPHWLVYIGADDVDATYEKAMAAKATSHVPPSDIPDVGRFAVLADPWGATFAIYKPGSDPAPEKPCGPSDVSWHEISADDLESSWGFYHSLFGWDVMEEHDMGPEMGTYRIFGRNGFQLGGIYKRPPQMPVNAWGIYILVDDVEQDVQRVEAGGGNNFMPPMEVPGGDKIAGFTDPQGAVFNLHSKKKG